MGIFKKKWMKRICVLCAVLLVIVLACAWYLGDYYRADMESIEAFSAADTFKVCQQEDGNMVFWPEDPIAGLIFYPGGKVEHTAYIPLMKSLAARGILCVLVEMPFRLAVLDVNAAEGIQEQYPQVQSWYIGGHSLGGSMAGAFLEKAADQFEGLILLGSYCTADLSGTDLAVLSVYGSEDQVMDREKYRENLENLPERFREVVLDGGCHAGFGMYGPQDGDGTPGITNETQILQTADAILALICP